MVGQFTDNGSTRDPSIVLSYKNTVDPTTGKLAAATIVFKVMGVRSICAGGTPLAPKVLWGFHDGTSDFAANQAGYEPLPTSNLKPIGPANVVRTDTILGGSFVRTWLSGRGVANPQRAYTSVTGVASTGLSATWVIADSYARCSFGGTVVTASQPVWVGTALVTNQGDYGRATFGGTHLVATVTDQGMQTLRPATEGLLNRAGFTPPVTPGGARAR